MNNHGYAKIMAISQNFYRSECQTKLLSKYEVQNRENRKLYIIITVVN